jgi:tetratricopeptide (TPR) repeat protein
MRVKRTFRIAAIVTGLLLAAAALLQAGDSLPTAVSHFNASLSLENEGKASAALAEMQRITAPDRDSYLVLLRLGWLSYLTQAYPQAETYYRQAFAASRDRSIEALLGLTLPLAAAEKWDEVIATYNKILSRDGAHYTATLRLGQIYLNRGDFVTADGYLSKVLDRYPGDYEANLLAGWNSYYLGRKADARKAFQNALMTSPGDTSATRGYALSK